MPMSASILGYSYRKVVPRYPGASNQIPVNLPANVAYPAGTILGNVSGGVANDVQTVTITGGPTGGTFTLSGVNPVTGATATYTGPYNAATSAVQTGLAAIYGPGNVAVTGSAGSSYVITAGGALAGRPIPALATSHALTGGTSPSIANVHTTTGGAGGTFAQYAQGNSNGSQNPQLVLEYDCATDASGGITFGPAATGGQFGEVHLTAPAYYAGVFDVADLPNYDANCAGKLGKLINNLQIRLF